MHLRHKKSVCGAPGDWLVFPAKLLLDSFLTYYCSMVKHFSEVKIPQTHLLITFNSIRIMVGYTIAKTIKINMWSDW